MRDECKFRYSGNGTSFLSYSSFQRSRWSPCSMLFRSSICLVYGSSGEGKSSSLSWSACSHALTFLSSSSPSGYTSPAYDDVWSVESSSGVWASMAARRYWLASREALSAFHSSCLEIMPSRRLLHEEAIHASALVQQLKVFFAEVRCVEESPRNLPQTSSSRN